MDSFAECRIGVIIPTHNRREYLRILLIQIREQIFTSDLKVSTVVIVDGSVDGTNQMLSLEFPEVDVIQGDGTLWWTGSINAGFRFNLEKGIEFSLIMNDDCKIKENFIQRLWEEYLSVDGLCVIGSISASVTNENIILSAGSYKPSTFFGIKSYQYTDKVKDLRNITESIVKTYSLSGRGTLIPSEILSKIGLFNNDLPQYGSDDDYVLRCYEFGIPVYLSFNSVVYTYDALTSKERNNDSLLVFLKALFFNQYSAISIKKYYRLNRTRIPIILQPIAIVFYTFSVSFVYLIKKLKIRE